MAEEKEKYPVSVFQSAPLTEARGDLKGVSGFRAHKDGFNPLPSPKRGETSTHRGLIALG